MKQHIVLSILSLCITCILCFAQGYNQENTNLSRYLERMYKTSPYEGVKVFTDYENTYLLSVVSLNTANYQSASAMNRVASVKASSQASKFFNGSKISSECIIRNVEKPNKKIETTIEEIVNENSTGYINMMELFTCFELENNKVFIYGKKIESPDISKKGKKKK